MAVTSTYTVKQFLADTRATIQAKGIPSGLEEIRRIHSIAYGDDTFFIRVTGGDVEQHTTRRFNLEQQTVEVEDRTQRSQ